MKQYQGFTVIELLICLAIISIMAGMALPSLQNFIRSSAEKDAAYNILAALRLARNEAIVRNLEYQVAFDLDHKRMWLERGNLPDNSTSWSVVRTFESVHPSVDLATKYDCSHTGGDGTLSADNYIQFNPNGTCGSSGFANSRYICVLKGGTIQYRTGVPSSSTGRSCIDNGP